MVSAMVFLSWLGSMLKDTGSMSANTGVAPSRATASAVAMKVKGEVKTASPGPTPRASRAMIRPSVPEAQPTAYRAWE